MSVSVHQADDRLAPRVRVVTAASLFDGHDAAINIVRRVLQKLGAEVIHLGHDRSVDEIVEAAVQEDAHAVAVSSYQGGHMEFFRYLAAQLQAFGAGHVRVYGGGGGTFTEEEIEILRVQGVAEIFGPEQGRRLGLEGMIGQIIKGVEGQVISRAPGDIEQLSPEAPATVARLISWLEACGPDDGLSLVQARESLDARAAGRSAPVVGITGTGGAGKSSVVDELVRRFRLGLSRGEARPAARGSDPAPLRGRASRRSDPAKCYPRRVCLCAFAGHPTSEPLRLGVGSRRGACDAGCRVRPGRG